MFVLINLLLNAWAAFRVTARAMTRQGRRQNATWAESLNVRDAPGSR